MLYRFVLATMIVTAIASTTATASTNLVNVVNQMVAAQRSFTPVPHHPVSIDGLKEAKAGCCYGHGGESEGCDTRTGHEICKDGSVSPTCLCK